MIGSELLHRSRLPAMPAAGALRRFLGLAAATTLLLAGFGTSRAQAETAPAFPVTIAHQWGSTTIPRAPQRVVVLGWNEADVVLALGVTPVAIQDWQQLGLKDGQVNPWSQALVHGTAPVILPRGDLDFRRIAALHPDLILDVNGRDNSSQANYALLSRIAPTVASPKEVRDNNLPWQQQVRIDALALGRVAAGERLIADTEARIAAARRAHPEFAGRSFSIDWGVQNGWHAYVEGDVRPRLLEDLGMKLSPTLKTLPARNYYADLPIERTSAIDADLVVLVAFARPAASLLAEPAVQALDAARRHRLVVLDNQRDAALRAAFATGSPTSIDATLDQLVPRIARALAGAGQ
ncbi:ABC transporter substrate-binding protein [Burkholderia gladioli]|uniref:ABC transporter substrate-binding protein n=1 Tax=Burkholderia gladioli TaxID=28095 RepID=UPI001C22CA72|nr:ABC transporter substrate-binding protein [Burkholderia gladioli]MBU9643050.1 ABC transporter substrate-binding protein [Burkholderia gladioli]